MSEYIPVLVSVVGGGGLGVFLTWLINNRKDKRAGLQTVIDNFNEDNKRLREEMRELRTALEKERDERAAKELQLRQEVSNLRSKLLIMESAHLDLPVPQWLKDKDGTMLALNAAYEQIFLDRINKTASDYIGSKDSAVWPEATAESFTRNDRIVMRTRKPYQTQESIDFGTHIEVWEILKYPRYSGSTLIGIGGIAFKKIDSKLTPAQT